MNGPFFFNSSNEKKINVRRRASERELEMKSHNLSFHKLVTFNHAEYEIKAESR